MMAMDGLSNLDFSCVLRSNVIPRKKSALKAIEKVKMVMVYTCSKKPKIPSSMNHSESSTSNDTPMSNLVLETPRSEEVQKLLEVILNAKNLVVICSPGVSVPVSIRSSCQSISDPFELLHPIIWQDWIQSSLVFQILMDHLNQVPIKNLFYQAIHSLGRRGNLLRVYTQNINAMEKTAGVLSFGVPKSSQIGQPDCPRCVPLLGRLDQMSCTIGRHMMQSATFLNQSTSDGLPICTACKPYNTHGNQGIMCPNIVSWLWEFILSLTPTILLSSNNLPKQHSPELR
ncbi:hypothetical protein F4604DRAFT_1930445 [Suillus subluteus]|nr:hypothetical protein F4604DRAFT_1930445 [Suillus subluteus]